MLGAVMAIGWTVLQAAQPASEATSSAMQSDGKNYREVEVRALNKVTARTELLTIPLGEEMAFGTITIIPRTCYVSASDKLPEQAVFLEVSEIKPEATAERIFTGWMFASSPALSALEHPVYDITMVACRKPDGEAKAPPAAAQ